MKAITLGDISRLANRLIDLWDNHVRAIGQEEMRVTSAALIGAAQTVAALGLAPHDTDVRLAVNDAVLMAGPAWLEQVPAGQDARTALVDDLTQRLIRLNPGGTP